MSGTLDNSVTDKSRRSRIREAHEEKILKTAEILFSKNGYNGTALEAIADSAGMSKQNLLYYVQSKEKLYHRVLTNILDQWVEKMVLLDQSEDEPAVMIGNYIRAKMEISRSNPHASKVFAMEIINGAPHLQDYLKAQLFPVLETDVKLVEGWIAQNKMDPVDPYHFFFLIWSSTQAYADFSSQMQLVLGKDVLDHNDFETATSLLTHVITKGIGLKS
ncbi:TetR family transcriptional regulator [Vibrio sp. S9_S30]|uniref:TetR/AcrR family transcriptional regulator n=1 Tax=Vibrio sp. S9_S30 TaxID=2720226 RepID=UPI00168137D2|nr:TetR/AcrR family transcriptional regulator [Vibrio sp. S9_S30]MBD1558572.1 TetR family transcriptional regulator [Vibrio sp. S9_S30]